MEREEKLFCRGVPVCITTQKAEDQNGWMERMEKRGEMLGTLTNSNHYVIKCNVKVSNIVPSNFNSSTFFELLSQAMYRNEDKDRQNHRRSRNLSWHVHMHTHTYAHTTHTHTTHL